MWVRLEEHLRQLSLAQRFMLTSLAILVAGMVGIGQWVGQQIEAGVIHRTAATTAMYVDSFVAPQLQELGHAESLTPEHVASLSRLLHDTPLGDDIAAFKVWDVHGRILYSTDRSGVGHIFPVQGGLARAWRGEVAARLSNLQDEENADQRANWSRLLEVYSPVRLTSTGRIIAVAEFYQTVGDLQRDITTARQESWLVVGAIMVLIYLLLAGFIRSASTTIAHQQVDLSNQIAQLTDLLAQNQDLHQRVRGAAARTAALNERFLRRISAELHDGPIQDIGLALLRLDHAIAPYETRSVAGSSSAERNGDSDVIQKSLHHALQEMRAIAAGLSLPHLSQLTLTDTLLHVVRTHERRTSTKVMVHLSALPEQAPLPIKITLYRLIQEALNNAYRHAGGVGQQLHVRSEATDLIVTIADQGAGFDETQVLGQDERLGLIGMRERVESLGGGFRIDSTAGQGTRMSFRLPLQVMEEQYER
jgi:signal transduction histidine kinase